MAVGRVAIESCRGQGDPFWGQCVWTQQPGGLTGISGRAGFSKKQLCSRGSLAADRSSSEARRQERLWRQYFRDPTRWWDHRRTKKSRNSPDFRHKQCQEVLWLNSLHKPAWVDGELAALDGDGPGPHDKGMMAETVRKLCDRGHVTEAVEALEAAVETHSYVAVSVVYAVLRKCVQKRDLRLGRRVHACALRTGLLKDTFLCNNILRMYASHGRLQDAVDVFEAVVEPDAFSWSAMISAHVKYGQDKEAVELYHRMCRSSVEPDGHVFVAALQACARRSDLECGQQVHAHVLACGLESDLFVCNGLVNMYAKCGSIEEARRVFDGLLEKDVVTWNAMIAGYSQQGRGQEALWVYSAMQDEGVAVPDAVTFVSLLQACASVGPVAFERGKQLHERIRERGLLRADVFVGNSLVNMYAKCGSLEDAQSVFDELDQKTVVTWNAMIAGYSQQGMGPEALCLYDAMQKEGKSVPDSVTFVSLLQACVTVGSVALEKGRQLHTHIRERGHETEVFVANSLVNMYAKCGSLEDAKSVFGGMVIKDVVTWNTMMAGYSQQGMGQEALRLYSVMQADCMVAPDSVTFVCLLQACAGVGTLALEKGKQLHMQIKARGQEAFVASSLVDMYAKCGSLEDAHRVFDEFGKKDVVTWNAMITGYSQKGMGREALHLYSAMQEEDCVVADCATFVGLLQACASVGSTGLEKGKQLDSDIKELGYESDVLVASSLVSMYTKCGSLEDAKRVFDGLGQKDVVTWNAMIAGYSQQGMVQEAFSLHCAMLEEGLAAPNSVSFVSLLQACASVGKAGLERGKHLHVQIREQGLQADAFVASSLVNMYAKCGSLDEAQRVFDGLGQKDVLTWTAMIAGYCQQGMGQEALCLYSSMQAEGIAIPDSVTFVCLLQACANVAAVYLGRQLHAQIVEQGLQADVFVGCSLINMYGKSGSMVEAQQVFDAMPEKDIAVWNALSAGYTSQGESEVVFDLVRRMKEQGTQPNHITFVSVLTACSHAGLVTKGRESFKAMSKQYGITPTEDHYTCMVDLLGRAGQLDEALGLVRTMPVPPSAAVWHTLLGACRNWSNVEVGRYAFHEAVKLDNADAAAYVLMSNIYTGAGMKELAQKIQMRRNRIRAWKQPGQSWWTDPDGLVHSFLVGDEKHTGRQAKLKQKGRHVPHLDLSQADLSDDRQEYHLCTHKQMFALAGG